MIDYTFKFVRDRSEIGEFFLEIAACTSSVVNQTLAAQAQEKVRKRICVIDIEDIEPV